MDAKENLWSHEVYMPQLETSCGSGGGDYELELELEDVTLTSIWTILLLAYLEPVI